MKVLIRIRAAWSAFRDPSVVCDPEQTAFQLLEMQKQATNKILRAVVARMEEVIDEFSGK